MEHVAAAAALNRGQRSASRTGSGRRTEGRRGASERGRTDKQVRERERGTEEPNRSCIGLDEQQRITWVSLTTF